jgi:hypothetical protein
VGAVPFVQSKPSAKVFERKSKPILVETVLLAIICMADMISTVILVKNGLAVEANPLLAWSLAGSGWAFIVIKTASFAFPLAIIEKLRGRCPSFIPWALRAGVVGYLAVYVVGSLKVSGLL